MRFPLPRGPEFLSVFVVFAACTSQPSVSIASDSVVVVNQAPDDKTPRWRLSEFPTLSVGHEGDSVYQFNRITGVRSLSDGRLVVANDGKELRFYGANGLHTMTIGRHGQGPEEIHEHLSRFVILPGDSVAATDLNYSFFRILVFGPDGAFARAFSLDLGVATPNEDGSWIGTDQARHGFRRECPQVPTVRHNTIDIVRIAPSLRGQRRLATLLGGYSLYERCNSYPLPYSARGHFAVSKKKLYTTADSEHVIHVRSKVSGAVERTIRTNERPRVLTEQMLAFDGTPRRPPLPQESGSASDYMRLLPPPPRTLPAIGSLIVDADDNLWVRRYFVPADSTHEWWVYDDTGHLKATVTTNAKFVVTEVGIHHVLGIFRDED